jgi:hypothetical protein
MTTTDISSSRSTRYELRFRPLRGRGTSLSFPCNDRGCVDMDALEAARLRDYLYARAVIGFEFACPAVVTLAH